MRASDLHGNIFDAVIDTRDKPKIREYNALNITNIRFWLTVRPWRWDYLPVSYV
jgi:hypothetical protein